MQPLCKKYLDPHSPFLASDDWLFCILLYPSKGSLQNVALKKSERVQKVKAVLQATIQRPFSVHSSTFGFIVIITKELRAD